MIDIHAHILPGYDDGAEDMYDTMEMLRMSEDSGVEAIVATPHCNLPGLFDNYFGQEYIERLSGYMASTGKQYQNHAATIVSWARQDHPPARQRNYESEEYETL